MQRNLVRLRVRDDAIYLSRGDTVLAVDRDGFLDGEPERGLFVHRTRLLSRYRCRLGRRKPFPVSESCVEQHRWLGYYIVSATPAGDGVESPQQASKETVELRIARNVGEGMHEDLDVANFSREPVELRLTLEIESDFADFDETRDGRRQEGGIQRNWKRDGADAWQLETVYSARNRYRHQGEDGTASIRRSATLRVHDAGSPPTWRAGRLHFDIALEPQASWHACLDWIAEIDGHRLSAPDCARKSRPRPRRRGAIPFLDEATKFESSESELLAPEVIEALEQAKLDLDALRIPRFDTDPRAWTVAAGIPMFAGLYGRDTTMVAWQAAMLGPELLQGTLPALARWQGQARNDWRDEQPGRILHESLTGPLAQLNHTPKARYFGSLTSSALFPLALAQLWRWTADRGRVEPLVEPALAALRWLDEGAREDHGVFYACSTRSKKGLENQTWKDSDDSIAWPDGSKVEQPVATCEEQGFVYAAKLAFAEVLWAFGRKDSARRLMREAAELKQRFDEAYWMDDAGCYAMALDASGAQVRSIGSNTMHALSSGIAPGERVERLVERLQQPDLYTGWGIRTLSSEHPAYNPYAYHRGSVWPVEHGPLARGARRFGQHALVETIARAQFEAAARFDYRRLPECFSGHPRDDEHPFPAIYPAANAPQAWSAATAVSLVHALLGLDAHAPEGVLLVDPQLPEWLPRITLRGLRVGGASVSIRFERDGDGRAGFGVLEQRGDLRVFSHPAPWSLRERPDLDLDQRLGA